MDDVGEDSSEGKEAREAVTETKDVLKKVCDAAGKAGTANELESASTKFMDNVVAMHKLVVDVHDCGAGTVARNAAIQKIHNIRDAFDAQNIRGSAETKMKKEATYIGKQIMKKALKKHLVQESADASMRLKEVRRSKTIPTSFATFQQKFEADQTCNRASSSHPMHTTRWPWYFKD